MLRRQTFAAEDAEAVGGIRICAAARAAANLRHQLHPAVHAELIARVDRLATTRTCAVRGRGRIGDSPGAVARWTLRRRLRAPAVTFRALQLNLVIRADLARAHFPAAVTEVAEGPVGARRDPFAAAGRTTDLRGARNRWPGNGRCAVERGASSALANSSAEANRLSSRAYERRNASSRCFGTLGFKSLGRSVPAGRSPVSSSYRMTPHA